VEHLPRLVTEVKSVKLSIPKSSICLRASVSAKDSNFVREILLPSVCVLKAQKMTT